jgi:hypothetical protein
MTDPITDSDRMVWKTGNTVYVNQEHFKRLVRRIGIPKALEQLIGQTINEVDETGKLFYIEIR